MGLMQLGLMQSFPKEMLSFQPTPSPPPRLIYLFTGSCELFAWLLCYYLC